MLVSRYFVTSPASDAPLTWAAAAAKSPVCFKREDFATMFTARVSQPDPHLKALLGELQPELHYPTFGELMQRIHHTEGSIYDGFKLPSDVKPFKFTSHTSETTVAFLKKVGRAAPTHPAEAMQGSSTRRSLPLSDWLFLCLPAGLRACLHACQPACLPAFLRCICN